MIKRLFDLAFAIAVLILLSPGIAILAVVVKVTSAGPVFYRGVRAGRGGRPFRMFKFRSMVTNADRIGGPSTAADDPRLTPVGLLMRRYKLDEIPQLINVVLGDMSIVGPRPEVLSEVAEYRGEHLRILEVRPGITDWASLWNSEEEAVLAGAADPHQAYKELIQPTKLALQLEYCRTRSFLVDVRIICSTALKLVRREWVPAPLRPFQEVSVARPARSHE